MLKEICITPQVFECHNIDLSNWKEILNVLESIGDSGYILGLNNKEWSRTVQYNINKLEPKIKDRLRSILTLLKDRGRIAGHPKKDGCELEDSNEDDWFKIAIQLDSIRKFYEIIATKSFDGKAISIKQLDDINIYGKFGIAGSRQYLQTSINIHNILIYFLSYAKKVTVIDPYFNLANRNYIETLKILAETFGERRGCRNKGIIRIHCKWDECNKKVYQKNPSEGKKSDAERWQQELIEVSEKYGHDVELCAWEVINKKLHDRYIITNQSGLVSAAGTARDNKQQSEWSIKDYRELNNILSQYTENANIFKLKCIISVSSIEYR